MLNNPCARPRPVSDPYEGWQTPDRSWSWAVLKKWQGPENEAKNPYARWFRLVKSPAVPHGEMGDVHVAEIKQHAVRIK